ncbi:MAG: outer membrane beta-barrel protein [Oxalobacteraceae bacterium]
MQKKFTMLLLTGLMWLPCWSYAEGSYLKVGVGQSRFANGSADTATGVLLAYGMQIDPSMDVEFGVIDFGRAKVETTFDDLTGTASWRTRSVYAAGIGNIPLTPTVNVLGKLGLSVNSSSAVKLSDYLVDQGAISEGSSTSMRVLLGTGLSMQLSKDIAGSIEYTYFGHAAHGARLSLFNAALRYHF